ncbi:MAG TPA: regulator, partial [Rhodocyclaceae bacterium]|nr:regulator [Rhodocyclaceae bacterium]
MTESVFIRREPVVNRQKAITATRVIVPAETATAAAAILSELAPVWPMARSVFVSLGDTLPDAGLLAWTPPE